jgi:hypothetical protein
LTHNLSPWPVARVKLSSAVGASNAAPSTPGKVSFKDVSDRIHHTSGTGHPKTKWCRAPPPMHQSAEFLTSLSPALHRVLGFALGKLAFKKVNRLQEYECFIVGPRVDFNAGILEQFFHFF